MKKLSVLGSSFTLVLLLTGVFPIVNITNANEGIAVEEQDDSSASSSFVERKLRDVILEAILECKNAVVAGDREALRSCLKKRILEFINGRHPHDKRPVKTPLPRVSPVLTPTPKAILTPTPQSAGILYETGVNKGEFEKWSLTPDWKHLTGMLVNDGTQDGGIDPAFAPYKPETADYAVEAEIRVTAVEGNGDFGIVVRATGQKEGYGVAVDNAEQPTFIRYLDGDIKIRGQAFKPGSDWHTYRVEIKGNTITSLIDGMEMMTFTDNRFLSAGQVGLWSNAFQLEVRSFKMEAL